MSVYVCAKFRHFLLIGEKKKVKRMNFCEQCVVVFMCEKNMRKKRRERGGSCIAFKIMFERVKRYIKKRNKIGEKAYGQIDAGEKSIPCAITMNEFET